MQAVPPDAYTVTTEHVRTALGDGRTRDRGAEPTSPSAGSPPETEGAATADPAGTVEAATVNAPSGTAPERTARQGRSTADRSLAIRNDMTGDSTGTGIYDDFVAVFRDRYERLSKLLRGRVTHRPTSALGDMNGGGETACIGMI
ncbi:MAG: DNA polymerase II small subunit, partial [Halobacteriales archaeon]